MVMVVSLVGAMVWVENFKSLVIVPRALGQAPARLTVARRIKGAIAHMVAISNPISML